MKTPRNYVAKHMNQFNKHAVVPMKKGQIMTTIAETEMERSLAEEEFQRVTAEWVCNNSILRFAGEHRWLSNFWPCDIYFDFFSYSSVEAAYVAAKTKDASIRAKIRTMDSPGAIKRYGRKIAVREDWEDVKLNVMHFFLEQKFCFEKNKELSQKLEATGDCLIVEGNTWGDTFWGVCNGVGSNHLGKMIMKIRTANREKFYS